MFVVVSIPQSNLTPHLVGKLKRAYIRTGQSSRPEIIVHPDRLPWLLDHRKKSERLRHILYDKAESHFENYLKNKNLSPAGLPVATLSLQPLYPQEPLTDYRTLPALIERCAPHLSSRADIYLQPVQDGIAAIDTRRTIHCMTEFNSYGLLMTKWEAAQTVTFNGHETRAVDFADLARHITDFFHSAVLFFNELSFGGALAFRLKMNNTRALRARLNEQTSTVLEDYLRLDENYNIAEITARLPQILQEVLQTAAWSLGLRDAEQDIRRLLAELLEKK